MDIDDVQNIDTLGANPDVLKVSLSVAEKLAKITQPFGPLISSVFVIVSEAVNIYEMLSTTKRFVLHCWLELILQRPMLNLTTST
ncbi:hypothetical protein F8M41_008770 [Gigaspora margarita]|uniref:Uncharacterized protein n=1 Tax=Gigaspora margarita TaxID=4874 RepID=A0A8H4AVE8_GIGMA|nr:hypothetical protein F8M41_008770 [Gigaspora margarita]